MLSSRNAGVAMICAAILFGSVGCESKKSPAPKGATTTDGPLLAPPKQTTQGDSAATSEATAQAAKIKASLALLSAADRALAEKQKICPVSGEPLGAMGAPMKVSVAGHDVFICCKSCEEPLANEPEKYLAKIGVTPAK